MSNSVRPHRRQPTRLPGPWDSLGKNTGVGCHFLLQYVKVKNEREVAQSCPTLNDPMDCNLPGSSVHGIFQAIVLECGSLGELSWVNKVNKGNFKRLHTIWFQLYNTWNIKIIVMENRWVVAWRWELGGGECESVKEQHEGALVC